MLLTSLYNEKEPSPADETSCNHKAMNSISTPFHINERYAPSLGVFHQQQQEYTRDIINARPTGTNSMYPNFHNMPYYENQSHVPQIKNTRLLQTSALDHLFTVSGQQGRNFHPNTDSSFIYQQSVVACKPEDKGNHSLETDITSGAKNGRRKRRKYNKKIHTASCHDIISGRGHGVNRHAGNVKFREIISRYKLAYSTSSPPAKKQITLQVLAEIQKLNPPGRFLVQNLEAKIWEELPPGQSKRKISQALREKPKKPGSGTKKTSETLSIELENNSKDDYSSSENDMDHDARSSDESDDESDSSNYCYTNRYMIQENNMNNHKRDAGLRGEGNDASTAQQQRFATQSLPPLPIAPQIGSKSGIQDQRSLEDIATNVQNYVQQLNQNILLAAASRNVGCATSCADNSTFHQHMNIPPKLPLQTSSTLPFQSFAPTQMGKHVQSVNQYQEHHPALMRNDFEVSNVLLPNPDRQRIQDGVPSFALSPLAGKKFKSNDDQTCAFVNYNAMSIRYRSNDDDIDNASIENANTDNLDSDKAKAAREFFQKLVSVLSTCENVSALYSVIRSGCESFSDFSEIFARREPIIKPADNDIIIIRKEESLARSGGDFCEDYQDDNQGIHIGNMRLVEYIQLFSHYYGNPQVAPDETRTSIVKMILKSIKDEGGRFLLKERDKDKGVPTFETLTEECIERILRSLLLQSCQYILFPACNDVLLGRDGVSRLNQGNMFFKSIILANKSLLQTLTCVEDVQKVAIEIIFQIRSRNGRFLMSCNQSGMWQILNHADTVEEVRRVLSEEFRRA